MADGTESERAPLWKRALPIVLGLGLVVFIFGWVLPQFIDYDAVFRAIGQLDGIEWILLLVAAGLRLVPEGWVFVSAQPGLSTGQGTQIYLVTNTLANVPPGGLDMIARYQMSRSWGFPPSAATSATVASWIFSTVGKLTMPILAVLVIDVQRYRSDDLDTAALIALVVAVVGAVVLYIVLRSERLATRTGELLGRFVRWVAGFFKKEVESDFGQLVRQFSEESRDVLGKRWKVGAGSGILAQLAAFVVLVMAIRFLGVSSSDLDWSVILGAFSLVAIVTTIPIFNMPGIAEALLIGTFTNVVGADAADTVAAAVFVYRILTWLLPVALGGFAFSRWRDQVRKSGEKDLLDAFDEADAAGG